MTMPSSCVPWIRIPRRSSSVSASRSIDGISIPPGFPCRNAIAASVSSGVQRARSSATLSFMHHRFPLSLLLPFSRKSLNYIYKYVGRAGMTVVAITREMGTLGKDVATGLGEALGLPVIYHEIIDHRAERMRVRRSHVVRLLDGKAGLLERLSSDRTSLFLHSAEEVIDFARRGKGAIIRGWGATHLLHDVPHVICTRICAPMPVRIARMMDRLNTDDANQVESEIRTNDEAHAAVIRRHFGVQWTDAEHYDTVLNTDRLS